MVINGISGGSSSGSYISSSSSSTSGLEEFLATLGAGIGFIIFVWLLINILFLIMNIIFGIKNLTGLILLVGVIIN